MRIPIVSRKEGANTKKGRKAFFRAYFLADSDRSVRGGSLRRCSGAIVAVLMLGQLSQRVGIKPPGLCVFMAGGTSRSKSSIGTTFGLFAKKRIYSSLKPRHNYSPSLLRRRNQALKCASLGNRTANCRPASPGPNQRAVCAGASDASPG
jgi:hypothetical protein